MKNFLRGGRDMAFRKGERVNMLTSYRDLSSRPTDINDRLLLSLGRNRSDERKRNDDSDEGSESLRTTFGLASPLLRAYITDSSRIQHRFNTSESRIVDENVMKRCSGGSETPKLVRSRYESDQEEDGYEAPDLAATVYQLSSAQVLPWFCFCSTSLRSAPDRSVMRLRSFIGAPSQPHRSGIGASSDKGRTRLALGRYQVGTLSTYLSPFVRYFIASEAKDRQTIGKEQATNRQRITEEQANKYQTKPKPGPKKEQRSSKEQVEVVRIGCENIAFQKGAQTKVELALTQSKTKVELGMNYQTTKDELRISLERTNVELATTQERTKDKTRTRQHPPKRGTRIRQESGISTLKNTPERYCKGTGKVLKSGGKGTGEVLESYQRGTKEVLTGSRSVVALERGGSESQVASSTDDTSITVDDLRVNRLILRSFRAFCEEFRCKVESMAVKGNRGRQIALKQAVLKTVTLMIFCVLFSQPEFMQAVAQTQSELVLQGEVRSAADGQTIEGASVKVDNKYARTDKQGKFTISVDKSTGVLLIKHIGYKEQGVAYENTSTIINIRLQPNANTIEEVDVVSTGYQKIDKNNTPGSIVKIDSGLLNLSISGSLTERLQNINPSFLVSNTVEGNKRIQIRGMYALREDVAKPLIILDNFPYEGELDDINPDEIESVNILRDASAAAIWGARAGNGVIVLNSRRANKNGFKLQLQTNTSIQVRPDLLSNSQILPSRDFLAFEQYKFSLNYGLSDTADYRKPALSPLYELLLGKQKGLISDAQMEAQLDKWSLTDLRDEYEKHVYQNQIVNRYNISLQHGSAAHMTMLNLGLENDTRDIIGNSGRRISVLLNNTLKPLPFLEIDLGVRFFRQKSILNGLLGYGQLQVNGKLLPPYLSFYNEQGEANEWDIYYRKEFTDLAGQAKLLDWKYRPLEDVGLLDRWSAQNNLLADLGLRFRLTPASLLQLSYRGESTTDQYHYYYPKESYYTRNLINTFTKIEQGTPVYQLPNEGMLDQNNGSGFRHFLRGQYNFDRRHGKHAFNAILGGEISLGQDRSNKNRVYGYNTKLNHASVPYNVLMPSYANVAGYLYIPYIDGLSQTDNRNLSFYGNAHYGWDGKYIVSASARRDASNLFGVNTNQKWKPLWSLGGLWKMQEESFFRLPLSILELRATYGKSGNVNRSVSALPTIMYYPASSQLTKLPYTGILGGYNPDLKWEEVNTLNFGINIASRGRRWKGSVEYYFKNARDVIADEPVDNTIGYTSSPKNSAHIDGRGLDISLDVDVIRGNSWRWQIIANYSIAKYKVSKYLGAEVDKYIGYVGDGSSISILEGYNPYTLVSYRWGGLRATDGSPLGFVDGEISDDYEKLINRPFHEQSLSGSAIPLSFGNVLNRISYKRIDLSFNISYKLGHYFRKNSISYEKAFLNNNIHSDYLLRWQNEGDEAKTVVPSMLYPLDNRRDQFYLNSDINVLNGAHVRLNDIRLSYTVYIDPLKKRRVPIALFANLNQINWVLWRANSEDIDPDYKDGYLPPKQWSFGMKVDF